MTVGTNEQRSLSNDKHASGQWRTRTVFLSNPAGRALVSFLSYKRNGVDRLARSTAPDSLVIDLGTGQGAYAHWFTGACRRSTVVAVDWSFEALRRMRPGRILRLCADAQLLPLKAACADALYSVDTLGHLEHIEAALDEIVRVTKSDSPVFIHSECGSYRKRWPDSMLMRRIGYDLPARLDGHISLLDYEALRALVTRRFLTIKIWSPAGVTGWLTGYPEKYMLAFSEAGCGTLYLLTKLFSLLKKNTVTGICLRLMNSSINHLEVAIGLSGGGSFFARLRRPEQAAMSARSREPI
jgi:SAM-dependent methyltransferase